MRVPLSWLQELVPLHLSVTALAERLTVSGIEVEFVDQIGFHNERIVAGKISAVTPMAKRPEIKIVQVAVASGATVQIVTGAPNIAPSSVGKLVPVALPGALLFDVKQDPPRHRTVKAAELYGEDSQAVLCSAAELGLSKDASEVLFLQAAEPGTPLHKVVTASAQSSTETVFVLAILPNIARCLSMTGVAGEVATLTQVQTKPALVKTKIDFKSGRLDPQVVVRESCPQFRTVLVSGVSVKPSPLWMQRRLISAGLEPLNNIVDASNFVLLELGQPTHMYDADQLPDLKLGARFSKNGEKFLPLGAKSPEQTMTLGEGVLLITSKDKPVAIAGVMGGLETAVRDTTTRVLLEVAVFDLFAVRRSQARTQLFTDASARYSRGVPQDVGPLAAGRLIDLLRETCPDIKVEETGVSTIGEPKTRTLTLEVSAMNAALGTTFTPAEAAKLLSRAFPSTASGDVLTAQVPPSRTDITIKADLMEEVVRIAGYDSIPATMPVDPLPLHPVSRLLEVRHKAIDTLVACGLQEILTYSLTDPKVEQMLGTSDAVPYVTLQNPVTVERRMMRRTLVAGLLETLQTNQKHRSGCQLFSAGPVFLAEAGGKSGLPGEPNRLALAFTGLTEPVSVHTPKPRAFDVFELTGVLGRLFTVLGLHGVRFEPAEHPWFHPGICAKVVLGKKSYGHCGALHPLAARNFGLEAPTFIAELDLDALTADATLIHQVSAVPRFPAIELDIALVVDDARRAQELLDLAWSAKLADLESLTVFDLYRGGQVPSGKKAIGLRITFRAAERTLTMEEAVAARETLVKRFGEKLGATLRT
jgi:phenylalanyl-tRNA synthetase beta chain